MKRIAIAGAGIGGLAAAIKLAGHGFDVHVFEQKKEAGGKLAEISGSGYRFDTGPSLFTMPWYVNDLLSDDLKIKYKKFL